jgi:transcriptional regulator with XRE-family HTH domain
VCSPDHGEALPACWGSPGNTRIVSLNSLTALRLRPGGRSRCTSPSRARARTRWSWRDTACAGSAPRGCAAAARTLSAWETGKSEPTPHKLAAVAAVLRVTVADLTAIPDNDVQLADLRFLQGLKQADVAKALGVPLSAVSRMERAMRTPTDDQLATLALLYDVDRTAIDTVWNRTRDAVRIGLRAR